LGGCSTIGDIMKESLIFIAILLSLLIFSCKDSIIEPENQELMAPSNKLSLSEVMKYSNIESISFAIYDSLNINGESKWSYKKNCEIYIDSKRIRKVSYVNEKPNDINVIELERKLNWTYIPSANKFLDIQGITKDEFETIVKEYICSHLNEQKQFNGDKTINGKSCAKFYDNTAANEFVWKNYKIPIQ
jgi:hypothetical protein